VRGTPDKTGVKARKWICPLLCRLIFVSGTSGCRCCLLLAACRWLGGTALAGGTARLCPENDARILFLRRVEGLAVLTSLLPLIGCKCRIADGLVDHIKHYMWRSRGRGTAPTWLRWGLRGRLSSHRRSKLLYLSTATLLWKWRCRLDLRCVAFFCRRHQRRTSPRRSSSCLWSWGRQGRSLYPWEKAYQAKTQGRLYSLDTHYWTRSTDSMIRCRIAHHISWPLGSKCRHVPSPRSSHILSAHLEGLIFTPDECALSF